MEIYESARKHGIGDEDIQHGIDHARVVADEDEAGKVLYLGPDQAGNLWRSSRWSETTEQRS